MKIENVLLNKAEKDPQEAESDLYDEFLSTPMNLSSQGVLAHQDEDGSADRLFSADINDFWSLVKFHLVSKYIQLNAYNVGVIKNNNALITLSTYASKHTIYDKWCDPFIHFNLDKDSITEPTPALVKEDIKKVFKYLITPKNIKMAKQKVLYLKAEKSSKLYLYQKKQVYSMIEELVNELDDDVRVPEYEWNVEDVELHSHTFLDWLKNNHTKLANSGKNWQKTYDILTKAVDKQTKSFYKKAQKYETNNVMVNHD